MALKPVTVSQLNDYIGRVIGTDPLLGAVVVKGESQGVKYHSTGHVYFSISDEYSKINCFLNRDLAINLDFQIEDGHQVIITGFVNVFKKNGSYSLNVRTIEEAGIGELAVAFAKMKDKLEKEGLFDSIHKKSLPKYPKKIGVITSPTGAAIKDIIKTATLRNNVADIILFPVLVQGVDAPRDISDMIDFVNANFDDIDILIVGRGGGSVDDLWAFNEEIVARSIYKSRIPVISAVGHEIDFTISDMVADVRAATPTAAAQIALPNVQEIYNDLNKQKDDLLLQLSNKLMYYTLQTDSLGEQMNNRLSNKMKLCRNGLEQFKLILEENNPLKVMEQGYVIITDSEGSIVKSSKEVRDQEKYTIHFSDGETECYLTKITLDRQ